MKKNFFYLLLVFVTVLVSACSGKSGNQTGGGKSILMPPASGRPYELLVVINQDMWERPAGRALYNVLDKDVPGLPQSERSFRIMFTDPSNFDSTLKLVRNIIIVQVDEKRFTQPKMSAAKDVYAAPQAILTIQAPTEASLGGFITENTNKIIDYFTTQEMNRQMQILETNHSEFISNKVKEMFDCDVWVSGELSSFKEGEDFYWFGTNTATRDRNFVIYSYPYTAYDTFTKEYFTHKRDSVMRVNIPGAREGMYMETDTLMTKVKGLNVQGQYALEARGLWRVKADMMGGPFVSHARVDTVNNRVVVAEVFVYSPDTRKRDLIRQMEASLYTLRLPGEKVSQDNDSIK